jgi:hypothetical protein
VPQETKGMSYALGRERPCFNSTSISQERIYRSYFILKFVHTALMFPARKIGAGFLMSRDDRDKKISDAFSSGANPLMD